MMMHMKVAVIFGGFTRNIEGMTNNPHFIEFMKRYNPTVFCFLWDKLPDELAALGPIVKHGKRDNAMFTSGLNKQYVLFAKYGPALILNLRSQYYSVKQAFEMIDDPDEFDVIIRLRDKLIFRQPFEIEPYMHMIEKDIPVLFSDWVCMGNAKVMKVYSRVYDTLFDLNYPYDSFCELFPLLHFAKNNIPTYSVHSAEVMPFVIG